MRTVRLGSARAAADELGLSPSALSRRIGNLEDFVGKKLFTRARQSMQLTDDGHAFFEAVNPQLEALARAVESQSENLSVLRLHLGVLPLFGTQRLFPRLAELRERHPLLHIDIDTGAHLEDRVGDVLDAAIILSRGPSRGLHAVRLDYNKVHAICSQDLAAKIGEEPDAEVLGRQTFLIHNELPESFTAWRAEIGLNDFEPAAIISIRARSCSRRRRRGWASRSCTTTTCAALRTTVWRRCSVRMSKARTAIGSCASRLRWKSARCGCSTTGWSRPGSSAGPRRQVSSSAGAV